MKKICLFVGLIFMFFFHVPFTYAYVEVLDYDFEDIMVKKGYMCEASESGPYCAKFDEEGISSEDYQYLSLDSDEEAIKYIKSSYDEVSNVQSTLKISSSYNVLDLTQDNYSYLSMDWSYPSPDFHYFGYYFRYKNVVIYGTADYDNRSTVKSVVDDLFKDKEPVKSQNIASDKGKKFSIFGFVKNNFHFVVIGCIAMTVIWVCITVILFMTDKKGK